jgi:hypothetical protein
VNRYAIIATRNTDIQCRDLNTTVGKLRKYLRQAGWEVFFERDRKSIFKAYTEGVASMDAKEEDFILLCHDDIEIQTDPERFNEFLDFYLTQPDTGFVGVAGSAKMKKGCNWFSSRLPDFGGGCIFHGKNSFEMGMMQYGSRGQVVCLDGVFLATTKKVFDSIETRKPKTFVGNWHWYDASYTLQAHIKGLKNYVVPIILRHESGGNYDPLFYEDMKHFGTLFKRHLPAVVN